MMGKSRASAASPMGFILGFGIVSMLMDIVYGPALGVGSFVGAGVTGALYAHGQAAIVVYALVPEAAACMLLFLALHRARK